MKEIIDVMIASIIFLVLLSPLIYITIKDTEKERKFIKEYYTQLERSEANAKH